jgi:hypothetical protein
MSKIRILDTHPGPFFHPDTLNAVFRHLADGTAADIFGRLYDGLVLACDGVEVFHRQGVNGVRVGRVAAVVGQRCVEATGLEAEVQPFHHHSVYLRLEPREVPLTPHDPGLVWLDPCPSLGLPSAGETGLELARLRWPGGALELDGAWWPPTATIASDPRSLRAAKRLVERLPAPPPSLRFLFGRLERLSWDQIIPELLRELWQRFEGNPAKAPLLREAGAEPRASEAVGRLLAVLEDGPASGLPPVLCENGRRFELKHTLHPLSSELRKLGGGLLSERCVFPALAQSGWFLALALRAAQDARACEVLLEASEHHRKRVILADRQPHLYDELPPGRTITMIVQGGEITAAGLYQPDLAGRPVSG